MPATATSTPSQMYGNEDGVGSGARRVQPGRATRCSSPPSYNNDGHGYDAAYQPCSTRAWRKLGTRPRRPLPDPLAAPAQRPLRRHVARSSRRRRPRARPGRSASPTSPSRTCELLAPPRPRPSPPSTGSSCTLRFTQSELRAYHAQHGIATEAWSPYRAGPGPAGRPDARGSWRRKYGKTPAQVVLRWHVQLGNIVLPQVDARPERMRDNIDVFDFELAPWRTWQAVERPRTSARQGARTPTPSADPRAPFARPGSGPPSARRTPSRTLAPRPTRVTVGLSVRRPGGRPGSSRAHPVHPLPGRLVARPRHRRPSRRPRVRRRGRRGRWTAPGKDVTYLLVTRGEAGIDTHAARRGGPLREAEERARPQVVGVDAVEFLDDRRRVVEYGLALRRDLAAGDPPPPPDLVVAANFTTAGRRGLVEPGRPPQRRAWLRSTRRRRRQPVDLPGAAGGAVGGRAQVAAVGGAAADARVDITAPSTVASRRSRAPRYLEGLGGPSARHLPPQSGGGGGRTPAGARRSPPLRSS